MKSLFLFIAPLFAFLFLFELPLKGGQVALAQEVSILHTNDLHSHFLPDGSPLNLGGLARLKSAVDGLRTKSPDSLLLDGGDWSEGNIFFVPSGGLDTLKLMKMVGYDAAVVGNHDWLNGPDHLLDITETATSQGLAPTLLGANIGLQKYQKADAFKKAIPPYVVKTVNGLQVAIIGLLTEDKVYQSYLKPIEITNAVAATKRAVKNIADTADLIVVVSHNNIKVNAEVLKEVPEVDLVVGAHDHLKLTTAIEVPRVYKFRKKPGWIVEAGSWGRYLGEVRLNIQTQQSWMGNIKTVSLVNYKLHQIDDRFPEDPKIASLVNDLKGRIETALGPIFHDDVCESEVDLTHEGAETSIGNFATDAYRALAPSAELAIDQGAFIYGDLYRGSLRTVDFFNANPGVFEVKKQQSWTVKTLPIEGSKLKLILNLLLGSTRLRTNGGVSVSGAKVIYSNWFSEPSAQEWGLASEPFGIIAPQFDLEGIPPIQAMWINGEPLDSNRFYNVALSGGAYESIEFVNSLIDGFFPTKNLKDTRTEGWRAMLQYGQKLGRILAKDAKIGERVITVEPDLGFEPSQSRWQRSSQSVSVQIKNMGSTPSQPGATVSVFANENGTDLSRAPKLTKLQSVTQLLPLLPGEAISINLPVRLPRSTVKALWVKIENTLGELNTFNNETILWLKD